MKNYKIAIGSVIVDGPWGGGNLFAKNLWEFLEEKNFIVVKLKHKMLLNLISLPLVAAVVVSFIDRTNISLIRNFSLF